MDSRVKQAGRVAVLPGVAVWHAAEVKKRGRRLRVLGKRSAAWAAGAWSRRLSAVPPGVSGDRAGNRSAAAARAERSLPGLCVLSQIYF